MLYKSRKFFVATVIFVLVFSLIFNTALALSSPTADYPQSGWVVPFGEITFKWLAISGTTKYYLSLRDLTTDTLLINRYLLSSGATACYETLNLYLLVDTVTGGLLHQWTPEIMSFGQKQCSIWNLQQMTPIYILEVTQCHM